MKEMVIGFQATYNATEADMKVCVMRYTCEDKNDLITAQRMIWEFLQKYIDDATSKETEKRLYV